MAQTRYKKPSPDELRKILTPEQFEVVRNAGTEPAFRNAFWDHHEPGLYVDVASGEPLFSSLDKFDSGTGWPSFTRMVEPDNVVERADAFPRHGPDGSALEVRRLTPRACVRRRAGADRQTFLHQFGVT